MWKKWNFQFFFNLRILCCTQNLFKYFKLDQNTPSIFRVLQASGIMIVFKHFFVQKFSIKICSWKSDRFLFYWLGVTPKNWPTVKKSCKKEKKWHQNLHNTSFNRAKTKIFWPIVNTDLGASENVVLTWPLTSWFLFRGLLFKSIFAPKMDFFD